MGRLRVAACLLAVFTSGCSLLDLRPLEVLAWAPASSTIASEPAEVWLRFSRAPARTSAEAAFSLSGTDGTVQGAYAWDGATLRFEPLLPLVRGMQYTLAVSRDAEDTLGNSLAADFVHRFRIGADTTRPTLLAITPADLAIIDDRSQAIVMQFSEPLDHAAFDATFRIQPSVAGSLHWGADTVTFRPIELYQWQTEYVVTIATELTDLERNELALPHRSTFTVGSDNLQPALTFVGYQLGPVALQEAEIELLNSVGWETTWPLTLQFDEPMDRGSIAGGADGYAGVGIFAAVASPGTCDFGLHRAAGSRRHIYPAGSHERGGPGGEHRGEQRDISLGGRWSAERTAVDHGRW
jgi:hypothetical protein